MVPLYYFAVRRGLLGSFGVRGGEVFFYRCGIFGEVPIVGVVGAAYRCLLLPVFYPLGWFQRHPVPLFQRSSWIKILLSCLDGVLWD